MVLVLCIDPSVIKGGGMSSSVMLHDLLSCRNSHSAISGAFYFKRRLFVTSNFPKGSIFPSCCTIYEKRFVVVPVQTLTYISVGQQWPLIFGVHHLSSRRQGVSRGKYIILEPMSDTSFRKQWRELDPLLRTEQFFFSILSSACEKEANRRKCCRSTALYWQDWQKPSATRKAGTKSYRTSLLNPCHRMRDMGWLTHTLVGCYNSFKTRWQAALPCYHETGF